MINKFIKERKLLASILLALLGDIDQQLTDEVNVTCNSHILLKAA